MILNTFWQFEAIGTKWVIETPTALRNAIKKDVHEIIDGFDSVYSRFRDDSLVAKVAMKSGRYDFPDNARALVALYEKLYQATGGRVTPLVGNLLTDAGYDKTYSLQPGDIRDVPYWNDVMIWNDTVVETQKPVLLDFGAAGKGYLVDLIGEYLESKNIWEYTIDASGDIRTRGVKKIIGLENPFDTSTAIGTIVIENESVCGSAVHRRAWNGWHHIVDPLRGCAVEGIAATWVRASSTILADGMATALFFVDAKQLNDWEFEYVRMYDDRRIDCTETLKSGLFVSQT